MWFTIGYAIVCAVGTWLLRGWGMLMLALFGAVLAGAAFCLRKHRFCAVAAIVAAGLMVGSLLFLGYDRIILQPAAMLDEETIQTSLRVTDYSWETDYGSAVDGEIQWSGHIYKVRLYLKESLELSPGDMIETEARFRLTDEGGEHEPTFHRTSGILLLGYQRGELTLTEGTASWRDYPVIWRRSIQNMLNQVFPADTAGFARALLLGDKTALSPQQTSDFSLSGISHVVAVSGLHVSILFSLIHLASRKRRWPTILLGVPALLVFGAMTGFTPSVTRAVIMQLLMLLALAVDREYDPPTALSFSVLAMLIHCPLVIASVGFQLSVASVAGIFLFAQPIRAAILNRIPGNGKGRGLKATMIRRFAGSVSVTLGATAMTTPLAAIHFHSVSLISVLTNLLVLSVISSVFYGIMLAACLGFLSLPLSRFAAKIVSWAIRYVLGTANLLARLPLAAVFTESPYISVWLLFLLVVILWTVFTRSNALISVSCCVIGLCVALLLSWTEPLMCDYRVTALDVGQGQCLILQSRGYTFVVDCGGDYDEEAGELAARTLLSQGICRIDGLILTHYDRDHVGGAAVLSGRIQVGALYLPGQDERNMTSAITAKERIVVDTELTVEFRDARIQLFPSDNRENDNESSLSVLFQWGKCDTLITGDLSADGERRLLAGQALPDLEVLIVGHHGSKYSTSPELLRLTAPDVAIISAGRDNSYGHPAPETLQRLEDAGCVIYRTDLHGTITYRG